MSTTTKKPRKARVSKPVPANTNILIGSGHNSAGCTEPATFVEIEAYLSKDKAYTALGEAVESSAGDLAWKLNRTSLTEYKGAPWFNDTKGVLDSTKDILLNFSAAISKEVEATPAEFRTKVSGRLRAALGRVRAQAARMAMAVETVDAAGVKVWSGVPDVMAEGEADKARLRMVQFHTLDKTDREEGEKLCKSYKVKTKSSLQEKSDKSRTKSLVRFCRDEVIPAYKRAFNAEKASWNEKGLPILSADDVVVITAHYEAIARLVSTAKEWAELTKKLTENQASE